MPRCLLIPLLLLLPLLLRAQSRPPAIDGYLGIKWLATPEAALARLDGLGSPRLRAGGEGFDYAIDLERVVGGRVFAVQLLFADEQFVAVHSLTPVLPGETFTAALADVRRGLDPALVFQAPNPEQLFADDEIGSIQLGCLRYPKDLSQVELSYHCRDVDLRIAAYERRIRKEAAVTDSARLARIRRFERDYALSFGGDDRAPAELLHGRKTAEAARPAPMVAAKPVSKPKLRKPTPAQRRQQAARRAWWRRTLRLGQPKATSRISAPAGMITPRTALPIRTPDCLV